jgi:hypothetical protein
MLQGVFSVGSLWGYMTWQTGFSSFSAVQLTTVEWVSGVVKLSWESIVGRHSPASEGMNTGGEEAITRQLAKTQQTEKLSACCSEL